MFNTTLQHKIAVKLMLKHDSLTQYSTLDVCYMLFKNLQISDTTCTGLRLTKLGNNLLSKEYDVYKFPMAEGLHNKLLLRLHDKMSWPYFLDKKYLYLYSEDDAMWLKMVGDDIEKFDGIFYAQNKFINTELSGIMITKVFPFNIPIADCWIFKHPQSRMEIDFKMLGLAFDEVKDYRINNNAGIVPNDIFKIAPNWVTGFE